jgi:hypothetical protein
VTALFPDRDAGGLLYQAAPPADEPELWDGDSHNCQCAVLGRGAPCSHCTDCPECNCPRCEDWHDTAGGETCPKLDPIQEEGHTMTANLPTKLDAAQMIQYGLRFPNGTVRWARGGIEFQGHGNVKVPAALEGVAADGSGRELKLSEALDEDRATLSHLIERLRKVAEDAMTDPDAYVAGVRVVKRTVLVLVGDYELLELPTRLPEQQTF